MYTCILNHVYMQDDYVQDDYVYMQVIIIMYACKLL